MKQQQDHHHRTLWTKYEDEALVYLKETMGLEKWTDIAKKLAQTYGIHNRNHQHCRDRYVNFLEHRCNSKKWNAENYQKLIQLYMQLGNKWSQIANHFTDMQISFQLRTGIMIKNKFYSRLRKGIRNVNYLIQSYFEETWMKLDFSILFKLVNCAANKYDFPPRNIISKKVEQKTFFVQGKLSIDIEIVRVLYHLSWMNKSTLKKSFHSQKQNNFSRQSITKLLEQINLIDENMEKKHSNRVSGNNQSKKKVKPLQQQIKNEKDLNQQDQNYQFQEKQVAQKMVLQCSQNKIENQKKTTKISIISTNTYKLLETSLGHFHEICNPQHQSTITTMENAVNRPNASVNKKEVNVKDMPVIGRYLKNIKRINQLNMSIANSKIP